MPNLPVTYETVVSIIEQLIAEGVFPTIAKIREALNNEASVPVVGKYLREWRSTYTGELPPETKRGPKITKIAPPIAPPPTLVTQPAAEAPAHDTTDTDQGNEAPMMAAKKGRPTRYEKQMRTPPADVAPPIKHVDFDQPYPEVPEALQSLSMPTEAPKSWEPVALETLQGNSKSELIARVRRLESALQKEHNRIDAAEKMAYQSRQYADTVRNMVSERIQATRDQMQKTIDQLKSDMRAHKLASEKQLAYYQETLDKANQKIVDLLPPHAA